MKRERTETMEMLASAAQGTHVAHVWASPKYPGAVMLMKFRWPDVEIDPMDPNIHRLPEAFVKDVGLEYAGTLTREEAAEKLAAMSLARRQSETAPF
jgi:hypothetical protein